MSDIRIKKVKYSENAGKIFMTYERAVNGQYDEYTFSSSEEAAPEFYDAFKKLIPPACLMLELPDKFDRKLDVYGVSFNYSKDDTMGAVISVKLELENSNTSVVINTPNKKSAPGDVDEFDAKNYLTEPCVKALWALEIEARKYIDGKRAQTALFDGSAPIAQGPDQVDAGADHTETIAS